MQTAPLVPLLQPMVGVVLDTPDIDRYNEIDLR